MAPCTHPGMKRLFYLKAKNGLGRFALSALPHYEAIYFFEMPVLFETGELNAYVNDGGGLYRREYV